MAVRRARDAGAEVADPALVHLLGFSIAVTDLLVRHPEEAAILADPVAKRLGRHAERG